MKKKILASLLILFPLSLGAEGIRIERLVWKGLEVAFIEDRRFPTYSVSFFFNDGSQSDGRSKGSSQAMFDLLTSGTRRFSQEAIEDNLEYYGIQFDHWILPSFSIYQFSGLAKDVIQTTKKICHLFADASYPKERLKRYKKVRIAKIESLVNSPRSLAGRIFHQLAFQGTPLSSSLYGTKIKDVKKLKSETLKKKRLYFNEKVAKRLYLTGPRSVLKIKDVILNECGWNPKANAVRQITFSPPGRTRPRVVLVTLPQANQAQVQIGRALSPKEIKSPELASLSSSYLGGQSQSKLMRELREKRGLSYFAFASVLERRDYGMATIQTSTKNKSLQDLLRVVASTVENVASGKFPKAEIEGAKGQVAGRYPFQFEKRSRFLFKLMSLDHKGRSFQEFQQFPERVRGLSSREVSSFVKEVFGPEKQTVLILGHRKLAIPLRRSFPSLEVKPYKDFL